MKDIGKIINGMEIGKFILKNMNLLKGVLKMILLKEQINLLILMEIYIKENYLIFKKWFWSNEI